MMRAGGLVGRSYASPVAGNSVVNHRSFAECPYLQKYWAFFLAPSSGWVGEFIILLEAQEAKERRA
jgi:hypothetical protein